MQDLHILPKLRDSLSYMYVEHAIIQRYRQSVQMINQRGRVALPIASLGVLLLGPGTSISHEAIKLLALNGCSVVWTGEDGMKFYAQGTGETRKGHRLLKQAELVSDPHRHREVAIRMYKYRFDEPLPSDLTIEQIRGHEGARVRNLYKTTARRYGVKWRGRRYDRGNWDKADPVNRALSAANSLLNGLCHTAIVGGGYSPGLGFIHTGKQLSFVYDIADLYKGEFTIPVAFQTVALGSENIEARVRSHLRDAFKKGKLLQRILPDIDALLDLTASEDDANEIYDVDAALPAPLWDDIDALMDDLNIEVGWEDE